MFLESGNSDTSFRNAPIPHEAAHATTNNLAKMQAHRFGAKRAPSIEIVMQAYVAIQLFER
ncbi:hypothetical protein LJR230_002995 [Trinickia sp. LjRoot230]|uniref:hypothetical protein n=1 Tax=Trinickia sp. LjRoot230 TaxID=3342288 RepID=UPI003ED153D2